MAHFVMLCEVDEPEAWEQKFRTHGEIFRRMGGTATQFTIDGNQVAMHVETADLQTFLQILQSEEIEQAMKDDGVRRETVRSWVLDREFSY